MPAPRTKRPPPNQPKQHSRQTGHDAVIDEVEDQAAGPFRGLVGVQSAERCVAGG